MAAPDELEKRLAELPRGRIKDSFQILAEWLRENREALQGQIAALAIRFEEIDRENKRRLNEIHGQTLKTNGRTTNNEGRITDLEQARKLDTALADGHEEWETHREQETRQDTERATQAREKIIDRMTSVLLVLLGLAGGALLPALLRHLGVS